MSHAAYPTANDLGALLFSSGMISAPPLTEQSQMDYASVINAAITEWTGTTGYTPFLADSVDVLRKFDPPGPKIRGASYGFRSRGGDRRLNLKGGLVSLTSVRTSVDATNVGTLRTLNTDFYLRPANAVAEGVPYTEIEFILPVWGGPDSIQILGKWGYGITIPDDAWRAILFMAALPLVGSLENIVTGSTISIREEDEEKVFRTRSGEGPFASIVKDWQKKVNKTINDYVRL